MIYMHLKMIKKNIQFRITKLPHPIIKPAVVNGKLLAWDALWAYHPRLIQRAERYYLFYTGKSSRPGIAHSIGLATSSDLKNWVKYRKNPVFSRGEEKAWDDDFVAHPYIFADKGKYYMCYDGSSKNIWKEEIGLATSKDLIRWKRTSRKPILTVGNAWWENRHVSRCCVYKKKGTYYLFYAGNDGRRERIGLAVGKDLLHLKRYSTNPIFELGNSGSWDDTCVTDPLVIRFKSLYLLFYTGVSRSGIEQIGVAVSNNLLSWTRYEHNPVVEVSPKGWDSHYSSRFDVQIINGKIYIVYSGKSTFLISIGLAEGTVT